MYCDIFNLASNPTYNEILTNTRRKKFSAVFGVQSAEKVYISANLERFTVFVTSDYIEAQRLSRELTVYSKKPFEFLPPRQEVLLFKTEGQKTRMDRYVVLYKIISGQLSGISTTPEGLSQLMPDAKKFAQSFFRINRNSEITLTDFCKKLSDNGFCKRPTIEAAGQFTVRGDIVDVFLPQYPSPVRFDFFDDTVEDIKLVDKETFRSVEKIEQAEIFAIRDIFNPDQALAKARTEARGQKLSANATSRLDGLFSSLETERDNPWLYPFAERSYLIDYLPTNSIIVWDEPQALQQKAQRTFDGYRDRFAFLLSSGEVLPSHFGQLCHPDNLKEKYQEKTQLSLQTLSYGCNFFKPQVICNVKSSAVLNYKIDVSTLVSDLRLWQQNGYKVAVFVEDCEQGQALQSQLDNLGVLVELAKTAPDTLEKSLIIPLPVARGFVSHSNKFVFVGCDDLFKRAVSRKLKQKKEKVFLDLQAGDYAVHELHGIGLCEGIVTLTGSFGTKDFIKLIYRDGGEVFVPVEHTDKLSRYSGSEARPKLSKIGGAEFEKVKSKVKSQIKEMAIDLLSLYAQRKNSRGFAYQIDDYLTQEFDAGFGFTETPDQLRCGEEINVDLKSHKIMDRLLVGDVGFGKTEVALRTAFKVVSNGKQVAFLAPTTILAEQHLETFLKRCKPFDISVECLNRFRTAEKQKSIIKRLSEGKLDIVVGTHRLLSKDVRFKNLGLLILDEEQRFGVEDKEKIKVLKKDVDVLSMSATPIPRTLYMALSGMKDISIISTPPKQRVAVETFVVQESDALIRDTILREKDRNGQVFVLYNRVEGIEYFVERLRNLVPEASFVFAHGQMREDILENNIFSFSQGEYDVLVCTTIIENGIDIPNANTILIIDADMMGLSQLYQLRGRVGRSDKSAYAYFLYKEGKVLSQNALKRLSGIMEYSDLGSGFKIAMRDLEIRGAGNVLGKEQHGHLLKVGYDMYVKLLNEVMGEIEGVNKRKQFETNVTVPVSAYVPDEYVPQSERMTLYQRIADISTEAEQALLLEELKDIYGTPPKETVYLTEIALLKSLCNNVGFSEVTIDEDSAELCFVNKDYLDREGLFVAMDSFKNLCRLDVSRKLAVVFNFSGKDVVKNLRTVKKFVLLFQ